MIHLIPCSRLLMFNNLTKVPSLCRQKVPFYLFLHISLLMYEFLCAGALLIIFALPLKHPESTTAFGTISRTKLHCIYFVILESGLLINLHSALCLSKLLLLPNADLFQVKGIISVSTLTSLWSLLHKDNS